MREYGNPMTVDPRHIQSVDALWRGMHASLEQFVARRTSSRQDAEDVVQDVFLRIHLALETSGPIDALDAWVYRIARNAVIDRYRRARPVDALDGDLPVEVDDTEVDELRQALGKCLSPFVDQLPEPSAEAVRMIEVDGLTQVEAALRAGISVSGMKSRIQRGRARLLDLVNDCCRFELDGRSKVIGYESRSRCNCDDARPGPK